MQVGAIIIGSGFGGAVAALRLVEAGVPTILLERGRREPVREVVETGGITIVQGVGVGGGSRVHAAITYQPGPAMFRRTLGDAIDYAEMDRVHYPRVRAMLNASAVPDDVLAAPCSAGARQFLERASLAGFRTRRLDLCVDWDVVRQEIAGSRKPSWIEAEFNSAAKNSLDRNYLAVAEATGRLDLRPLHRAVAIAEGPDGGFRVFFERIDDGGVVVARDVLDGRRLFLAAGSIGTSTLLLRARSTGALPRLSEHVGHSWGTNGDRFLPIPPERRMLSGVAIEDFDNPEGPVVLEDIPDVRFAMSFGGTGTLRYDPARDEAALDWPADDPVDAAATRATVHTGRRFEATASTSWVTNRTMHPLGGAVIGKVCDSFGRVSGYDGLYVVDGALLPGNAGCANPSLTIAALAERAMDRIVPTLR